MNKQRDTKKEVIAALKLQLESNFTTQESNILFSVQLDERMVRLSQLRNDHPDLSAYITLAIQNLERDLFLEKSSKYRRSLSEEELIRINEFLDIIPLETLSEQEILSLIQTIIKLLNIHHD